MQCTRRSHAGNAAVLIKVPLSGKSDATNAVEAPVQCSARIERKKAKGLPDPRGTPRELTYEVGSHFGKPSSLAKALIILQASRSQLTRVVQKGFECAAGHEQRQLPICITTQEASRHGCDLLLVLL